MSGDVLAATLARRGSSVRVLQLGVRQVWNDGRLDTFSVTSISPDSCVKATSGRVPRAVVSESGFVDLWAGARRRHGRDPDPEQATPPPHDEEDEEDEEEYEEEYEVEYAEEEAEEEEAPANNIPKEATSTS